MKAPVAIVLAAGLSALGGGWLAAMLMADDTTAEATDVSGVRLQRLERQLSALVDETSVLSGRLRDLELRGPAQATPERELIPADDVPRMRLDEDQMAALTAAAEASGEGQGEGLEDQVAAALERIRLAEDSERDERRQKARDAAMDEHMKDLTEQLALDTYQAGRMREALDGQNEKRDEIFSDARENGTWGSMRESMTELRETTRTSLETFLTPSQLESYDAMPQGGTRWGRGGFGGGPGGGRGPGGGGGNTNDQGN